MATRRPLVLVSGLTSELPDGDSVVGVGAGSVTAGSGLDGGGDVSNDIRLDVQLAPNPSGIIYVGSGNGATIGLDGAAQASGNAALNLASVALASGNAGIALAGIALTQANNADIIANAAFASGNAALALGTRALASGNAGISLALQALASGNAALASAGYTYTVISGAKTLSN